MDDFSLPENLAALAVEDIQELIEAAREEFHALNDSDSLEDETLDRMTELADAIDSLHDEFVSKVELAISKRDEISAKVFGTTTFAKKTMVEDSPEEEATETPDEEATEDEGDEKKKPFPGAAKPFGAAGETEEFADTAEEDALETLRTNLSDAISALDASPPKVALALQELHAAQKHIHPSVGLRVVRIGHSPAPTGMSVDGIEFDVDVETIEFADAVTKSEIDGHYPASDYAYVPDAMSPSTWKLRLTSSPSGDPDARIVGAAVAALGKGFRGNKVQIPAEDLGKVKAKVRAAWLKANPDRTSDDLPSVLR